MDMTPCGMLRGGRWPEPRQCQAPLVKSPGRRKTETQMLALQWPALAAACVALSRRSVRQWPMRSSGKTTWMMVCHISTLMS